MIPLARYCIKTVTVTQIVTRIEIRIMRDLKLKGARLAVGKITGSSQHTITTRLDILVLQSTVLTGIMCMCLHIIDQYQCPM